MKVTPGLIDCFISPVTGNISGYTQLPKLPLFNVWEGNRAGLPEPSPALIDIRLDIIELRRQVSHDSYLPFGMLFQGNSSDIAVPVQTINLNNLPPLDLTSVPNPAGGYVGQIYEGTDSGVPIVSNLLGDAIGDIEILNGKFLAGKFVMNSGLILSYPSAQFMDVLGIGMTKLIAGGYFALAIADTDYTLPATFNAAIDNLQAQIDAIDGDVAALDARVTALEADVAAIDAELVVIEGEITGILASIATIEGEIATLTTGLASAVAAITALQGEVAEIETDLGELQSEIDDINSTISSLTLTVLGSANDPYIYSTCGAL